MDGKGRLMYNVFIERLWRSVKYECVYLKDFDHGGQARQEIGAWLIFIITKDRIQLLMDIRRMRFIFGPIKREFSN